MLEGLLLAEYGESIAQQIADGYSYEHPVTVRINTLKADVGEVCLRLLKRGFP